MVVEQGPGGPFEWTKKATGTIMCKWSCNSCGMKAGNSSRLLEVLRKPCGALAAHCSWDKVNHDTEVVADRVICRRCGTTRQRYVDLSGQACPVRRRGRGARRHGGLWRLGLHPSSDARPRQGGATASRRGSCGCSGAGGSGGTGRRCGGGGAYWRWRRRRRPPASASEPASEAFPRACLCRRGPR